VRRTRRLLGSTAMLAFLAIVLLPVVFMVIGSLRPDAEAGANLRSAWENYTAAMAGMHYWRSVGNTLLITACTAVLTVITGSLCAWALARHRRFWTTQVYQLFVVGLTVPVFVLITPLYLMMRDFGLLDSHLGVVLTYTGLNLPFAVLFYSSFLRSIPPEVEEQAIIDGCSPARVFLSVVFPLLRPATATLALFVALAVWNDLVGPLVFLSSGEKHTVTQATYSYVGSYGFHASQLFPAVVLGCLPLIAVFLVLQRHIVAGITAGVAKG
jgi:raffinose/stachyose/melibiose transport system permease protein